SFLSVKPGEHFTLVCPFGDNHRTESVIWYQQRFGEMPQKIGERLAYKEIKISPAFESVSDSVPAGAAVTLQCSVLSESRAAELQVLWFRAAPSQSHPQLIYTHHNSSLQCESESSTHTCVYKLSKNIFSLNDTGTYYCAVVLCGKIIFGNGT
ncbi:putative immune-type receptor 13 isoform 1 precursor, partial [Silurus meridionalis]